MGVVQLGVVQLGVVQLGVVQMGVDHVYREIAPFGERQPVSIISVHFMDITGVE